jgi:hypothetical protein
LARQIHFFPKEERKPPVCLHLSASNLTSTSKSSQQLKSADCESLSLHQGFGCFISNKFPGATHSAGEQIIPGVVRLCFYLVLENEALPAFDNNFLLIRQGHQTVVGVEGEGG